MQGLEKAKCNVNVSRWTHPSIKACPDCGHKKPTIQRYIFREGSWVVKCDNCFCRSVICDTAKEAVLAWNSGKISNYSKYYIEYKEKRRKMADDQDQ